MMLIVVTSVYNEGHSFNFNKEHEFVRKEHVTKLSQRKTKQKNRPDINKQTTNY